MLSDFLKTKLPIEKLKIALEVIDEFRCLEDENEYPFTKEHWVQLDELRTYLVNLIEKKNKEEIEMYCSLDINPIKFNKGFYVWGQKSIVLDKGDKNNE